MYKRCEILCVGTELLLGDIINTNAAYLARELTSVGIGVYYQSVVGDNRERLTEAMRQAMERCDLVLVTGGLGPTNDDLTKETAAALCGTKLVLHEESLNAITKTLSARGIAITESQRKQAMQPERGLVFRNLHGTAPGSGFFYPDGLMVLLPGPPAECEPIFAEEVLPYLRRDAGTVLVSHNLHLFGIGEAAVGEKLYDLMEHSENPTVAPYCTAGEVRLRVTASAATKAKADELCAGAIRTVRDSEVGQYVYGVDECDSLQQAVVNALRKEKKTVAAAESCTAGYIVKRIGEIPGASEVLEGSFVTYSERIKQKLVGVRKETLETYTVVSEEVAREMAEGARHAADADYGVSVTGIAGPGGGTEKDPVGTVCIAVASDAGTVSKRIVIHPGRRQGKEQREYIRLLASSHALSMLLSFLPNKPFDAYNA